MAALAAAVRYLGDFHKQHHVRKVKSDIRGL
jgi:hypothetical protein